MYYFKKLSGYCLISFILFAFLSQANLMAQSVTFDDSDPDTIIIDNGSVYRLALLKENGAFAYIREKATGVNLILGDASVPLWTVESRTADTITSTDFIALPDNQFTYIWDASNNMLTLQYSANAGFDEQLNVSATITATDNNYFDLQITVLNESGQAIRAVDFPHFGLNMQEDTAVIAARYPGTMLYPKFFKEKVPRETGYPEDAFADFVSLSIQNSHLSIYTLWNGLRILYVHYALWPEESPGLNHTYYYYHDYGIWIEDDSTWISNVTRLRIGQSTVESLKAYRSENHIDVFPSLQTKLGDQFDIISKSPLYSYHFGGYAEDENRTFQELPAFIEQFATPAILLLTTYYPGGYHGYSPDYLPPDPQWGTTEELTAMIGDIQAQGKLVMPLTGPFWWHENSPTIQSLGQENIIDISRIDEDGNPDYFALVIGDHEDWGYGVSLYSPFVQQRLNQVFNDIFSTLGADIIYEDIAPMSSSFDFNVHSPSPNDNLQGWLEHGRDYKVFLRMGEKIFDRGTEYFIGNLGIDFSTVRSTTEPEKLVWAPYPVGPILYNDKIATYEWLDAQSNKTFSGHILFGSPFTMSMQSSSLEGVVPKSSNFQEQVMSRLYGKQMIDYTVTTDNIAMADYGDIKVTRNGNYDISITTKDYTLPPYGVLVESDDGALIAGIFSAFNGDELVADEPGDHYLIQENKPNVITLKHLYGPDTPIKINIPPWWTNAGMIKVTGYTYGGNDDVAFNIDNQSIRFNVQEFINDEMVSEYKITYGITGISETEDQNVSDLNRLIQNHPNPFNTTTTVEFQVTERSNVNIKIYNMRGLEVCNLVRSDFEPGVHTIEWNGTDDKGNSLPTGVYLIRLVDGDYVKMGKCLLLK